MYNPSQVNVAKKKLCTKNLNNLSNPLAFASDNYAYKAIWNSYTVFSSVQVYFEGGEEGRHGDLSDSYLT